MITLIFIIIAILVGAFLLLRSPSTATEPSRPLTDEEAASLRDALLAKLRDRLPGQTFEASADNVLEVVIVDGATERQLRLDLSSLAARWLPLQTKGDTAGAETLLEDFVRGATGESASDEDALDSDWAKSALAVRLTKAGEAPKGSLTAETGRMTAVLVLRSQQGADAVSSDDVESFGFPVAEAFAFARANLARDVEEGLPLDVLQGTHEAPIVVRLAPADPLAASYALVPGLGARLAKRFGDKEIELLVAGPDALYAAIKGTPFPALRETAFPAAPSAPAEWAWKS